MISSEQIEDPSSRPSQMISPERIKYGNKKNSLESPEEVKYIDVDSGDESDYLGDELDEE